MDFRNPSRSVWVNAQAAPAAAAASDRAMVGLFSAIAAPHMQAAAMTRIGGTSADRAGHPG
jgi:hypothetical protein